MSFLRFAFAAVVTIAMSGAAQAAVVTMSIEGVAYNPNGASFFVRAKPDVNIPAVGAYAVNMTFGTFEGGLGSPLSVNITELFDAVNFTAPTVGSTSPLPTNVASGGAVVYTGQYGGPGGGNPPLGIAGADLFKVDFTVPGGFNVGQGVTVTLVGADTTLTPTGIDSHDLAALPSVRLFVVPEPGTLALFGIAASMIGLGLRRRF